MTLCLFSVPQTLGSYGSCWGKLFRVCLMWFAFNRAVFQSFPRARIPLGRVLNMVCIWLDTVCGEVTLSSTEEQTAVTIVTGHLSSHIQWICGLTSVAVPWWCPDCWVQAMGAFPAGWRWRGWCKGKVTETLLVPSLETLLLHVNFSHLENECDISQKG